LKQKRKLSESLHSTDSQTTCAGPSLPPIYCITVC
jgi:hypothetical protein